MPYTSKQELLLDGLTSWLQSGIAINGGFGTERVPPKSITRWPTAQVTPGPEDDPTDKTMRGLCFLDSYFDVAIFVNGQDAIRAAMNLCGRVKNRVELRDPATSQWLGDSSLQIFDIRAVSTPDIAPEEVSQGVHRWVVVVRIRHEYQRGSA